jgi:hypoxanthine phosphoribosyltransferase
LIVIGLLNGSFIFLADLIRHFHRYGLSILVDFLAVSSYGRSNQSSGQVIFSCDITTPICNRHVLLIDDIIDTGLTLDSVYRHLKDKKPASLRTCVFLAKNVIRKVDFQADYVGFHVPNVFVIGYGLDSNYRFRELPYISAIHEGDEAIGYDSTKRDSIQ